MNEFEPCVFNSGLVLNYLLRKKNSFTLYLEDGAKLTGTLLGWDADFLFVKENINLQMVQLKKITRLQTELEQIIAVDEDSVAQQEKFSPPPEVTRINSTAAGPLAKFKPTLTEVKSTPIVNENDNPEEKGDFKSKLDHLVKNW